MTPKQCSEYKNYQQFVIEFLTQKCVNQDGLILYHYMGSGKTFTSIGLAINLGLPIVLLAPKGLLSMWQSEYFNVYDDIPPVSKMLSYEEFWDEMEKMDNKSQTEAENWRKKHVLIADEAHNLSAWLSSRLPVNRRNTCLNYLFQFNKRILLTGTPIYWGERDLSFLTNIACGRVLLPIDDNAFRKKYYSVIKKRSFLEGWMVPVTKNLRTVIKMSLSATIFSSFALTRVKKSSFKKLLQLMQISSAGVNTVWYKSVVALMKPILDIALVKIFPKSILSTSHAFALDKDKKSSHFADKFKGNINPMMVNIVAQQMQMSTDDAYHFIVPVKNLISSSRNIKAAAQVPYIIICYFTLYIMAVVIKRFYTRESDNELLQLNYNTLVSDIGPYISYYKPANYIENTSRWRQWLSGGPRPFSRKKKQPTTTLSSKATFPTVNNVVETVSYNERQTAVFMRYTIGKMSFQDYTQLAILQHEDEGHVTSYDQTSPGSFRLYGRMIGNSCVFKLPNKKRNYAYMSNIHYDSKQMCYMLKDGYSFDSVSPKFKALYKRFSSQPLRRVVYSNFNEASAALSAYFTKKDIAHKYLRDPEPGAKTKPTEYKIIMEWVQANKNAVLIIGQSYSEGLSVKNIDEMHIIDPCESVAKNDQTKGRVARLGSHPPGSTVHIIEWITNMKLLSRVFKSTSEWFKNAPYVWYNDMLTNHKQSITPDAVVYREVNKLAKSTDKVIQLLRQQSIEHYIKRGYPTRCESKKRTLKQVCTTK